MMDAVADPKHPAELIIGPEIPRNKHFLELTIPSPDGNELASPRKRPTPDAMFQRGLYQQSATVTEQNHEFRFSLCHRVRRPP